MLRAPYLVPALIACFAASPSFAQEAAPPKAVEVGAEPNACEPIACEDLAGMLECSPEQTLAVCQPHVVGVAALVFGASASPETEQCRRMLDALEGEKKAAAEKLGVPYVWGGDWPVADSEAPADPQWYFCQGSGELGLAPYQPYQPYEPTFWEIMLHPVLAAY